MITDDAKIKLIIDTDIADDIDDAVAISFALGSPEFEILGVTTVFGDVDTRTRVARKLLREWGHPEIPVIKGCERPLGFAYPEGAGPEVCSQKEAVAEDDQPLDESTSAPDFISRAVRRCPNQVYVLTLGAKTNVAAALSSDPSLAMQIPAVISLAGKLPPNESKPSWNVRYDPLSAQVIARSGVRWVCICADLEGDNSLRKQELSVLRESGHAGARFLLELARLMQHNKLGKTEVRTIEDVPSVRICDTATLAYFMIADQFDLRRGRIEVDDAGGFSFTPDADGQHELSHRQLPPDSYRAEILRRIMKAQK